MFSTYQAMTDIRLEPNSSGQGGKVHIKGDVSVTDSYSITTPYLNSLNHVVTNKLLGRTDNLWLGYAYGASNYLVIDSTSIAPNRSEGLDCGTTTYPFYTVACKQLNQSSDIRLKDNKTPISYIVTGKQIGRAHV